MNVKQATLEDVEDLVAMAGEFEQYLIDLDDTLLDEIPKPNVFRKYILEGFDDPNHSIFLAMNNKESVGFADVWVYPEFMHGGRSGYLQNIYVKEKHRHRGVGALLLKACIKDMKLKGAVAVHICAKKNNTDAISFYRSHGIDEELVMLEKRLD